MEIFRTVGLLLLVLCACLISGCTGTRGTVLVGQPEVFTRERLIDGRYEDYEWLRGKLKNADDAVGFQGFVDETILDITIAKIEAEYKMDLPDGKAEPPAGKQDAPGGSATSATTTTDQTGQNKADEPSGSSAVSVASEPLSRKAGNITSKKVPSGKQASKTEAELPKIDQLNDQLAYRSAVRAAMRQSMVDDSHDLTGGMLYDLKFDVAIVPGDDSRRNAVVLFTIDKDRDRDDKNNQRTKGAKDEEDSKGKKCASNARENKVQENREGKKCPEEETELIKRHEYIKWAGSVEQEINELSLSLQQKLLRGTLSSTDTRWRAPEYYLNETLDASGEAPQVTRTHLAKYTTTVQEGLDKSILGRAKSIIESFGDSDVMEVAINLESLRGIVLQLWESATSSSQFHQEILAILESALISVESPNENQLSVFREAIADLERDVLAQVHVDVIRGQFIREGFSPLALLSEVEDVDGND